MPSPFHLHHSQHQRCFATIGVADSYPGNFGFHPRLNVEKVPKSLSHLRHQNSRRALRSPIYLPRRIIGIPTNSCSIFNTGCSSKKRFNRSSCSPPSKDTKKCAYGMPVNTAYDNIIFQRNSNFSHWAPPALTPCALAGSSLASAAAAVVRSGSDWPGLELRTKRKPR